MNSQDRRTKLLVFLIPIPVRSMRLEHRIRRTSCTSQLQGARARPLSPARSDDARAIQLSEARRQIAMRSTARSGQTSQSRTSVLQAQQPRPASSSWPPTSKRNNQDLQTGRESDLSPKEPRN